MARTTDDWRQNSPANRRSRTTASSWARVRWRARTRALRARIRQSPHLIVYLTGCRAFESATASSRSWISFLSFPVSQTRTANAKEAWDRTGHYGHGPCSSRHASSAACWRRRVSSPRKQASGDDMRAAWAKEGTDAMTVARRCWRWESWNFQSAGHFRTMSDILTRWGMTCCQGDRTVGGWHDFWSSGAMLPQWHG